MPSATITQVTDNDSDDLLPQTDGQYIVWQGFGDGESDILLWDGDQIRVISNSGADDLAPQIKSGLVVWTSEPLTEGVAGQAEIVLYDIAARTSLILSESVDSGNVLDDTSPRIHHDGVSWIQTDDEDNATIYFYDFSTGAVEAAPDRVTRQTPQSDGSLTVLKQCYEGDRDLFLYSECSKKFRRITQNHVDERYPALSGHCVAWIAEGEVFLAKVQYIDLITPAHRSTLSTVSPPVFAWEGLGYDAFKVVFSNDPGFPARKTLTLPRREKTWLSTSSFEPNSREWNLILRTLQGNETLYWKVKGRDAAGHIGLSATYSFSSEGEARSPRPMVRGR